MEKHYKKNYKKSYKKMDLLKDLKNSLLNFSIIMIYTIHKISVLIKNHLKNLKDNIFKCFLKSKKYFLVF